MRTPKIENSWLNGYGRLKEFVGREGHARVRHDFFTSDGFRLGSWVVRQRNSYAQKRLTAEQIKALEVLPGWCWNLITDRWIAKYKLLRAYAAREGHILVPARYKTDDGAELGNWVVTQRCEYRRKKLPAERIKALEALPGWYWEPLDAGREKAFNRIKEFVDRVGHSRASKHDVAPDGFNLGRKVQSLRQLYKKNLLPAEFARRLETLPGWTWVEIKTHRQEGYEALLAYVAREGHALVPKKYRDPNGFRLGIWVENNRTRYHNNKLSQDSINALEAVPGWSWGKTREERWAESYKRLIKYFKRYGHTRVPFDFTIRSGFRFGQWVDFQRRRYKQNKLSPARIRKLEGIGFEWEPGNKIIQPVATRNVYEIRWQKAYERLAEYAEQNRHTCVRRPYRTADGFKLGIWVTVQRVKYRRKKLSEKRIAALENLPGWHWDPSDGLWFERYGRLRDFAIREGHSNVMQNFVMRDGFHLGAWVRTQRLFYRSGKISRWRIDALEGLPGWLWSWRDSRWSERYELLREFIVREGHAKVPIAFSTPDGFRLGIWVRRQRKKYKNARIPDWRIKKLEQVGFEWRARRGRNRALE